VVREGDGRAYLMAKNGQKVVKIVHLGPNNHEKYFFEGKKVVAVAFGSV
jgi:hypothetical protein